MGAEPIARRPWSTDEDALLRAALDEKKGPAEIAPMLPGRTRQAVACRLSALRKQPAEKPQRSPWDAADDAALLTAAEAGESRAVIAGRLKRSVAAIDCRLNFLRTDDSLDAAPVPSPPPDPEPDESPKPSLREINAQRVAAAHAAAMAAEWRPALTAEQVRDALARGRRQRLLQARRA